MLLATGLMEEFIQLLLNGLVTGSIIAVTASGLTLVTSGLGIINLAHPDYLAVGAFAGLVANVNWGIHILPATLVAIVATMTVGVALELVLWRPIRRRGAGIGGLFLVSFALALVMRNTVLLIWGAEPRRYGVDVFHVYRLGFLQFSLTQALVVVVASSAILFLAVLLLKTRMGKRMRAVADSAALASVSGVDVDRTAIYLWALAAGLAGLGGVLQGLLQGSFNPNMGVALLLPMFAAITLGGPGNPLGALVGGLALGMAMELSTWNGFAGGLPPGYKPAVAFAVLIVALLFRPHGILGRPQLR